MEDQGTKDGTVTGLKADQKKDSTEKPLSETEVCSDFGFIEPALKCTSTEPFQNTCWKVFYGPVKTMPTDTAILPKVWGSNNTGELKALIELFDYLLYYANLPFSF